MFRIVSPNSNYLGPISQRCNDVLKVVGPFCRAWQMWPYIERVDIRRVCIRWPLWRRLYSVLPVESLQSNFLPFDLDHGHAVPFVDSTMYPTATTTKIYFGTIFRSFHQFHKSGTIDGRRREVTS